MERQEGYFKGKGGGEVDARAGTQMKVGCSFPSSHLFSEWSAAPTSIFLCLPGRHLDE